MLPGYVLASGGNKETDFAQVSVCSRLFAVSADVVPKFAKRRLIPCTSIVTACDVFCARS